MTKWILIFVFSHFVFANEFLIVMRHGIRMDVLLAEEADALINRREVRTNFLNSTVRKHLLDLADEEDEDPEGADLVRPYLFQIFAEYGHQHMGNLPLAPDEHQEFLDQSMRELIRNNRIPEVIITSPYWRAVQTAQRVRAALLAAGHPNIQILQDPRLQEWAHAAFGRLGHDLVDITSPVELPMVESPFHRALLENEMEQNTFETHRIRLGQALQDLARRYPRAWVTAHNLAPGALMPDFIQRYENAREGGYIVYLPNERGQLELREHRGVIFRGVPPAEEVNCSCEPNEEAE